MKSICWRLFYIENLLEIEFFFFFNNTSTSLKLCIEYVC